MVWPTDPASGGEQPVATAPAEISTEAIVAQVYREVVGRTQVAPDADFFTIGGDSLKAALVVARVRDRLGVQLNVADVFEHSTVRALAAAASRRHPVVEMARIPRRGNLDPCALSSGQKRIWFLDQLEPGTPRHNIIEAFRWQGPLDVEALERAVTTLIERHEILRTTYHDVGGKPVQAVTERPNVTVTSRDVRHLPYEARAQEVQRLLEQDAARPFDLSQDLPIRVIVTCVDPDEWVLFMSVHHIACDGWSFNALHTELAELYTADRAGRAPDLPELPIQYADFALWDMQRTAGSRLDEGLKYWRRQLGGSSRTCRSPAVAPSVTLTTLGLASRRSYCPRRWRDELGLELSRPACPRSPSSSPHFRRCSVVSRGRMTSSWAPRWHGERAASART